MITRGQRTSGTMAIACVAVALVSLLGATLATGGPVAEHRVASTRREPTQSSQIRIAFSRALPAMDGSHLAAKLIEVTYEPGGSSPPHRHPCAVVGYVLEGALRVKVNDGPEVTYKAGEAFYEAPNDRHVVSANASRTERARLLANFTCDHDAPLTVPAP